MEFNTRRILYRNLSFLMVVISLAIIGGFAKFTSNSLNDFIFESNKGRHISFVSFCTEAIKIISNK
ncbi:MAG: DUF4180 domain-containing protein [Bacteroidales bacterium]